MPSVADRSELARRRYLAVAAGSLAAALAGCGDDTSENRETVEIDHYTDWVPARDDLGRITADRPAAGRDAIGYDPELVSDGETMGIDVGSIDRRVRIGRYVALSGEFTADEVVDGIAASLESDGAIGDYDRYVEADAPDRIYAVRDGAAVLQYPVSPGNPAVLEAIVDAQTGAGDRLVDEDDDIERLVNELPSGDLVAFRRTPGVDSWAATGISYAFDATRASVTGVIAFADEAALADLDDETIRDRATFWFDIRPEDPDVSRDGRVATVSGTVANEDIR